jgi:hypothetical protein
MTEQTTEAPAPVISMDVLAKCYLNLRNKIQEITKQAETQVEILKAQQEEICTEMRRRLQEQGATSLKTPHGTVMLRVDRKYYATGMPSRTSSNRTSVPSYLRNASRKEICLRGLTHTPTMCLPALAQLRNTLSQSVNPPQPHKRNQHV